MGWMDIQLTSWSLDLDRGPLRQPPRRLTLRHGDYEDNFDFDTVFYDCFWGDSGENIILLGPPLLNLKAELELEISALPSGRQCDFKLSNGHHITWGCVSPPPGTS